MSRTATTTRRHRIYVYEPDGPTVGQTRPSVADSSVPVVDPTTQPYPRDSSVSKSDEVPIECETGMVGVPGPRMLLCREKLLSPE